MSYSQEKYNLWDCKRDNDNKPSIMHLSKLKKKKYNTEKVIAKKKTKQNNYRSFKNKWHLYKRKILYL